MLKLSAQTQIAVLWWGFAFFLIYATGFIFLLKMMPFPSATQGAEAVAAFYRENSTSVRIGTVLCIWTGGFMLPLVTVICMQLARIEKGVSAWNLLVFSGGILLTIFLAIPPFFWGVAAFSPDRSPEITALAHQLACLTYIGNGQYFPFLLYALGAACLLQKDSERSIFPKWYGYFSILTGIMFEPGPLCFIFKTGPFAWNGLFVYWVPFAFYGTWMLVSNFRLIAKLNQDTLADALS